MFASKSRSLGKLAIPLIGSLFLQLISSPVRTEEIHSFTTNGTLTSDGVLSVSESIEVDATGSHRQWLHRIIPTTVDVHGKNHSYRVHVQKITDEKGHAVPFTARTHPGAVTIRMEAPRHAAGHHNYRIQYEIRGACNFHKQHPQLFWAATGNEWPLPIKTVHASLHIPSTASADSVELKAWAGPPGSDQKANVELSNGVIEATASEVPPGSGLDMEIDFNAGGVSAPGILKELQWLSADWYLLVLLPLLSMAVIFAYKWLRVHRKSNSGPDEGRWAPPNNLTPVEIGTLWDQSCDMSDITTTMLDLAVRGYFTIREIPGTGFFQLSDRDYEFKKLRPPLKDTLRDHEELFMEALFGQSITAYLSNVQGIFRQFIPKLEDTIYSRLVAEGFLVRSPKKARGNFVMVGVALAATGIAALFLFGEETIAKAATNFH